MKKLLTTLSIGITTLSLNAVADLTLEQFGGSPTPGWDNTPALNAAVAAIRSGSTTQRVIALGEGGYHFITQPQPIDTAVVLSGKGKGLTVLFRDFSPTPSNYGLFTFVGQASGSRVESMGIAAKTGTSGGSLISVISTPTVATSFISFNNLYLTTEGYNTHTYTVYIDGSAKTTAPVGVRDIKLNDCAVFGASLAAIYIKSAVSVGLVNTDAFSAGGQDGRLLITGTSLVPSYYVSYTGSIIHGLYLDNVKYANVNVAFLAGPITNASSAENILVSSGNRPSYTTFWTNGKVISP